MTGARLRVDLGRLRGNITTVRERVSPAEVMLVVKDDAYGHGLDRVVAEASAQGVTWFGAFDIATGVRTRAAGGAGARVLSWATAARGDIAEAIEARLDLGIGDADYLEDVAHVSAGRRVPVHLKVDTGLHRNGVRPEEWAGFVARAAELEAAGHIRVVGVWSHIAETSDESDDEAREVFVAAVATARRAGLRPDVSHLAASAAAHARPEFRQDLARIGAFAYGVRSAGGPELAGIVPVATLLAPVAEVADDGVRVALGALDGLPSALSGRVRVGTPVGPRELLRIDGFASTIASWPGARVGDEVALFGPGSLGESSATTLAEAIDTVGEEILVRVSPLVRREYVETSPSDAGRGIR